MIDPAGLVVRHRVGTQPPPTAEVIGTLATPDGGTVVAAFGRGRRVLCWWPERPTQEDLRAFHGLHGFAAPPAHPVREAIEALLGPGAVPAWLAELPADPEEEE
jgi:hypothetical protein